jgi:thiol-disulfide isomerase/thioredoxin
MRLILNFFLLFFTFILQGAATLGQDYVLKVGELPPTLDFNRLYHSSEENQLSWNDLDNRVVVLDFWATWCPPCIESVPHLNQLVREFQDSSVTFISITYEPEHMVKPFLEKYPLRTIIGIDNDFAMFKSYKASSQIPY